jgi:hypothetical protein
MEQLYWNFLILLILLICVVWIHYYGYKDESFFNIGNFSNFAPIPFIFKPQLNYFDDMPGGYDSATRSYYNPYFAQQVAQGLDTN